MQNLVWQCFEPTTKGAFLAALTQERARLLDELRGSVEMSAGQCMAHRLRGVTFPFVPCARPKVELSHHRGLLIDQSRAQNIGEEVVIAVPVSTVVERDEEQIRSIEHARAWPCRGAHR